MVEIPNKIFNRKIEKLEIGKNSISFFQREELENAQIGFAYDSKKNELNNWIGKEYVVIGKNKADAKAPIIAKVDEEAIPVFAIVNDGWKTVEKIANSFEQYENILEKIKATDLYRSDKISDLIDELSEIVPEKSQNYWEDLINSAYNYLAYDEYEE